jgi:hypothetical protein
MEFPHVWDNIITKPDIVILSQIDASNLICFLQICGNDCVDFDACEQNLFAKKLRLLRSRLGANYRLF